MGAGHGEGPQIATGQDEARRGLLLVSPPAIYALLMLAAPMAAVLLFSFWSQDFLTIDRSFTTKNYVEAFSDPLYRALLIRSIAIALSVTVVTVALAYPVAYFVSFHVHPSRKSLWIFLITIPFWTSYLIRVFLWKVILGFNGVINSTLLATGLIDSPLQEISYSSYAVVLTLAHAFAPFAILPIFVALERIDRSLLEASQDLGESKFRTFLRVTLPLSVPGLVAAVLIVFIPTIGDYVTPRLVGGPNGLMIANMIQTQFLKLNNAPLGAALAVVAMASVTAISLLFIWVNRRNLRARR